MLHLIKAHSLDKVGVPLKATAMSLQLKERGSTASVTLEDRWDATQKDFMTNWIYDDASPGRNMVWRATNITDAYHTETPTLNLEHIINVLRDKVLFDEITPETISGVAGAETCSAKAAIQYVLGQQSDWELGDYEVTDVSQGYSFEGSDSVYDALETISSTLEGAWWEYSTSQWPFKLHIRKKNDSVDSAMNTHRNLRTISRTLERGGMYTRFWPVGKEDLHLKGQTVNGKERTVDYVADNTDDYGIIDHTETDESKETAQELYDWAKAQLELHSNPVVKIEVEGLELADATGEPLDRITLGRMCRMKVSDSKIFTERVIEKTYTDKINQPESIRITLSNKKDDVTKIIAKQKKETKKTSRVAARQNKQTKQLILNTVKEVTVTGPVNNVYTLKFKLVKDTDWQSAGTFSRATTLSGAWSGGELTVSATPQGNKLKVALQDVEDGEVTWSGSYNRTGTISVYAKTGKGDREYTGKQLTVTAPLQHPTIGFSTWSGGSITISTTPSAVKNRTIAIFDTTSADVSWSGRTGTIKVYVSHDGSETKIDTGKELTVTAPVQHPTIGFGTWTAGTITITTNPSAVSNRSIAIFDTTEADVSWSGRTGTIKVYVSHDGSETKIDTGKELTVTAPVQHPTIGFGTWTAGAITITTNPSAVSNRSIAIFDTTSADVTWSGTTGTIKVYVSHDGGETKIDTGKELTVTAPVQHPTIGLGTWTSGAITISTTPSAVSNRSIAIFDAAAADVTWSGQTGSIKVYVSHDGGETKIDTGKVLTVTAPDQHPTIGLGTWSSGSITISTTPSAVSNRSIAIFDTASADVTWSGQTASIKVYVSHDGGETKIDTGKVLTVTAPDQHPTIGFGNWSSGSITISTTPSAVSNRSISIFDIASGDVSWSGQTATISVFVSHDGGETRIDTGKRLTVTAPDQHPTISFGNWNVGTITISSNPQPVSVRTISIFNTASADVTWSGRTGTIAVYVSHDGGETRIDTGKRLSVVAPVQNPTISFSNWSLGTITISTNPSAVSNRTISIFDTASGDVSWSGRTGTISVYASHDDGETRIDTGKRLTVTAPVQHPTISFSSWSSGSITISTSPSATSNRSIAIFDATSSDVTWDGKNGSLKVYVSHDGSETKTDTKKTLSITAPFTKYTFTKAYDSNDNPYKGPIYDAHGNLLSSSNLYWYGYGTNFSATVNVELWRHN